MARAKASVKKRVSEKTWRRLRQLDLDWAERATNAWARVAAAPAHAAPRGIGR